MAAFDTDIAIIGGGPVGTALALALQGSAFNVTVLEARAAVNPDPRPIALSHGSRLLLERLGVWGRLACTEIAHIHVSHQGAFGRVALSARDTGVPALGYVVDYHSIAAALAHQLQTPSALACSYRVGARASAIGHGNDFVRVDWVQNQNSESLRARLLVIADGGDIDGLAPPKTTDYEQWALTARVRALYPHRNTAYERFTPEGPLALLPFGDEMALVWTLTAERAAALEVASPAEFLTALRSAFGSRLGEFVSVAQRARYPLSLRQGADGARPRTVAIGNAAQTLHPVAGQGFNLGLRDVWELAQALRTQARESLGDAQTLSRYRATRHFDRQATVGVTHGLVRFFSNEYFLLDTVRGVGMTALGCVPPLRDVLARRMMFGVRG